MKNFINEPVISCADNYYLMTLVFMAPLLNFLAGVSIDLYAPSLPTIAHYFGVSAGIVKNTITATMLGVAFGCTLFGILVDAFGRRKVILCALIVFIIISLLAPLCSNISELMIIRFIQGMVMSAASIGSRALVFDNFTGKRFAVVILYTSMAYAVGPAIAPFIGGLLQYYFNWQANFFAYAILGILLLLPFFLLFKESLTSPQPFSIKYALMIYKTIISHKHFLLGIFILSGILIEQMIYPTLGPFLVENTLGFSAISYGNSAFLVGASYLFGTLMNRFFIHKTAQCNLASFGIYCLAAATIVQFFFALLTPLNLFTLIFPITLMGFSLGFIFSNVLGACLKFFPNNVGAASAVQAFALMVICAVGIFVISYFNITSLLQISYIYMLIVPWQVLIFFTTFRKVLT